MYGLTTLIGPCLWAPETGPHATEWPSVQTCSTVWRALLARNPCALPDLVFTGRHVPLDSIYATTPHSNIEHYFRLDRPPLAQEHPVRYAIC